MSFEAKLRQNRHLQYETNVNTVHEHTSCASDLSNEAVPTLEILPRKLWSVDRYSRSIFTGRLALRTCITLKAAQHRGDDEEDRGEWRYCPNENPRWHISRSIIPSERKPAERAMVNPPVAVKEADSTLLGAKELRHRLAVRPSDRTVGYRSGAHQGHRPIVSSPYPC